MTLTFMHDLDMVNVHHHTKFGDPTLNGSIVMNFFSSTYYLVTFGIVRDRQTDRQMDRRKSMNKSPPCVSTGGLNKYLKW